MVMIRDFAPTRDDIDARFGKRLGRGLFRTAYAFGTDKVVKYERKATANRREWAIWCKVQGTPLAKYLCPMLAKSSDDCTLIQKRARTFEQHMAPISRRINKLYYSDSTSQRSREKLDRLYAELDEAREEMRAFVRDVENAFDAVGIGAYDLHDGNIGFTRDGRMIVLDYGNFMFKNRADREAIKGSHVHSCCCDCSGCSGRSDSDSRDNSEAERCDTCGNYL